MAACHVGEVESADARRILRRLNCIKVLIHTIRWRARDAVSYAEKRRKYRANQKALPDYSQRRDLRAEKARRVRSQTSAVDIQKNNAKIRADYRKLKSDPEWIKRRNARSRRYLEKLKKDPVRWAEAVKLRRVLASTYSRLRRNVDPNFHMTSKLRCRLYLAVRNAGTRKSAPTAELLGCSVEEFCRYIESKFTAGMSWENRSEWHLDHIKPCSKFDLTKPEQQRECFNFTNIQPLWKLDNLRKGARVK